MGTALALLTGAALGVWLFFIVVRAVLRLATRTAMPTGEPRVQRHVSFGGLPSLSSTGALGQVYPCSDLQDADEPRDMLGPGS